MFTNGTVIVLFWVADFFFYGIYLKDIDDIISNSKYGFLLEREEDMASFLGLKIDRDKEKGTIASTQTGLIDRIVDAAGMAGLNLKYTPAEKDPLYKDLDGEPCCEE